MRIIKASCETYRQREKRERRNRGMEGERGGGRREMERDT